ncbi:sodium-independent sulfate anion transporter-like [Watersipora subatra]|uniref:sodium-independent sulfate anion transporter-like n=1 Tax=Watersipora subatra TaxID=2589382 RepID=UPI00355C4124
MAHINGTEEERRRLCDDGPSTSYKAIEESNSTKEEGTSAMTSTCESIEKYWENGKDALCSPSNPLARYCQDFWSINNVKRKFPFIKWAPKYRLKNFIGDLVAGLTVGLTVIPQGMAYAQIAELPPQYGLYSAFMGGFIYCFLGTSKDITMGPTAIMSLLVAEFASERAPSKDTHAAYAIILTLICGLAQILMGFLNLGFVVQFISFPVISGFTCSAAIIIGFSQVKSWLGLKNIPRAFVPQVRQTFIQLPETNLWDMTMGIICMISLVCMKILKEHVDKKLQTESKKWKSAMYKTVWIVCTARNAVVVLICAIFAAIMVDVYGYDNLPDGSFLTLTDKVDSGIPLPQAPQFYIDVSNNSTNVTIVKSPADVFSDIGEGFIVVTLIGLLESIAIAKAFARKNEYQIDPNQELIAIGASNTISSFFHSYPITGSFSRTAINSQSGVTTPAGGIWTGLVVILALAVLTPYFSYIPQTALAAVIICAVLPMFEYELIPRLFKVKKLDLLPLTLTFFLCIFINIEVGILSGVGLTLLILIYPMSRPELTIKYEKSVDVETGNRAPNVGDTISATREAVIIEPNQGLKFPGIEYIKDKVMKYGAYKKPATAVILDASHFAGCDYTMVQGVTQVCEYFYKHKLQFVIACASTEITTVLHNADIKGLQLAASIEEALRMSFANGEDLSASGSSNNGKINDAYVTEVGTDASPTKDESL